MTFAFATVVSADHTISAMSATPDPVVAGNTTVVSATTTGTSENPRFKLFMCQFSTFDGAEQKWVGTGVGTARADCADQEVAVWHEIVDAGRQSSEYTINYNFDTTPYLGAASDPYLVGFRAEHPPEGHTGAQSAEINVSIVQPSNGGGDRHQGCNGIENALEKVSNNGGSSKNAKAQEKLAELAEAKNCDV